MAFTEEKRNAIKMYILEKIDIHSENIVEKTASEFGVSKNTVYRYMRELNQENKIKKENGKYVLVSDVYMFEYYPQKEHLEEDIIYYRDIEPYISKYEDNIRRIWEYSFMEMMNNAIDHSEADTIDCYIIQDCINTSIIISDDGIGIFEKIRKFYQYNTLDDAISELFKGKLTTDSNNHSGEGIFFTSRILDIFCALSDGKIFSHDNFDDICTDLEAVETLKKFKNQKGTEILMMLSNKSNKTTAEVFDMYSDDDGKFTKTKIPIKNFFASGFPVSRSQAKRLTNRFENFEEIELDFDGVDEIGQGFAHELFVVFNRNHPKVVFSVLNANNRVQKMINHVKVEC